MRDFWSNRWKRYAVAALLGPLALLVLVAIVLNSGIGHRFVADRIAAYAPASGLRISVGRIDGSLWDRATLHNVTFSDPRGPFLRVPEVRLNWRPLHWFTSGLDVRELRLRRGRLTRLPKLRPGDPDAPVLPNFDIRVDRFSVEDLTVAAGLAGPQARRVSLDGRVDIRSGRALVRLAGRLGGGDRLAALLDAEPDRDKLKLGLDYVAPKGGLLAELAGARADVRARIVGQGTWRDWRGALLVEQEDIRLAALRLTARSGVYGVRGQLRPDGYLAGAALRAAGDVVALDARGTLRDSVLAGRLALIGAGATAAANGAVDLDGNRFDRLRVNAAISDPALAGPATRIEGARLAALIDGPFRDLSIEHTLGATRVASGGIAAEGVMTQGIARFDGEEWRLPLALGVRRIVTGDPALDRWLEGGRVQGLFVKRGNAVSSEAINVMLAGANARLVFTGDMARGGYALAGPVAVKGWPIANLGTVDARSQIVLSFGNAPWKLRADLAGAMTRVDNETLVTVAGTGIRFAGQVTMGGGAPLLVERASLAGSRLRLTASGRRLANGTASVNGRGSHVEYGDFTVDAQFAGDGPRAVLVFAEPLPGARLTNVRIAIAPIADGFRLDTQGGSPLGPFDGVLNLYAQRGGPTRVVVDRMNVWQTAITGAVSLGDGGANGRLQLAGGGVDGTVALAPRGGGQGFDVALRVRDARFGGASPISIGAGDLTATGTLVNGRSTISASLNGQGIAQGNLFLGRVAAKGRISDGRGEFIASLAGRRGSRFSLQVQGSVAPERLAIVAAGDFAGQHITMPRRAVLTAEEGGWRLAPSQLNLGTGRLIVSGLAGGRSTELDFAMDKVPLSVADILVADLGLGGSASGLAEYRHRHGTVPTGTARLMIKGLSRSGLVLTSRPVDLALVGRLGANVLETRAVVREQGQQRGRIQARIANLPGGGTLMQRLRAGSLFAQLRYDGPADAIWRLVALEAFDLTGPVALAADVTGTIDDPRIAGSLASDNLRLQSAITGTDVSAISARGRFSGSRLDLVSMTGRAANGGTVVASGTVDFTALGERAPALDLRLAARNALLLARSDMAASVTGPLRVVSDGVNGTIAGRLAIDTARWQLGRASAAEQLPQINTREINRRADIAPPRRRSAPWRFLIDAAGDGRVDVRGLGLDSEWSADIGIRGTTAAPTLTGRADLVRGGYEFAGTRFELQRGRIRFVGDTPPNPRLDIVAETNVTGLTARVTVAGTSLKPEITFSSTPALPEEELLARLLFGTSVTDISAPEALQLGAALASLRSGGGLDPINRLRSAIGLDRLRIVSADASLGRGTGLAAGKYLGRRFYAEVVTDGRGYSATQLEFRITNWLSLLGSVSTMGRQSINARVSKDY